jgi:hypothetical protein
MRPDEEDENFTKALLISIGYMALFTLFVFIPLVGFVIAISLGAYVAGYRGANYSVNWRKIGLLAGLIWSTIFIMIFLLIGMALLPLDNDIEIGGAEIMIICIPYAANILFCALGARARFKERAVYI